MLTILFGNQINSLKDVAMPRFTQLALEESQEWANSRTGITHIGHVSSFAAGAT